MRSRVNGMERVLVVGESPLIARLVAEIDARPSLEWRVVGMVENLREGALPEVGPWLGPMRDLGRIIAATCPTRIVLAPAARRRRTAETALLDARLQGIAVEDAADTLERVTGKLPIERLTQRSLVLGDGFHHSDFVPSDSTLMLTRLISVVGACVGLVLLSPLLLLIALAIKIDSRGPVLFRQSRVGMGGRPFALLKFRTMHDNATRASEWVCDNEHRITRVGRWLRRFRMDELPQLVNVVRGEMNLVGPRPHPVSNYPLFLAKIPHYRVRLAVRPGMTGWSQVRYGYANGLDEETEKMRYDLYYIKHRSMMLDLGILLDTVTMLMSDSRSHERVRQAPVARPTWSGPWNGPRRGVATR